MKLSDFDFYLPLELIAQHPCANRDGSRLLKVCGKEVHDYKFTDIVSFLQPGDVLVLNNAKVIPALLKGWKVGRGGVIQANINLNLNRQKKSEFGEECWEAFIKPARKVDVGTIIYFGADFQAEVLAKKGGVVVLRFNKSGQVFKEALAEYGAMPLPQYIKRDRSEASDDARYQTVYASNEGAVAAPTAGLHFTSELLDAIIAKGIDIAYVTLHVGAGTFLPVKCENIFEHKMHSEWFELNAEAARKICCAKRVICVGTTTVRVLESVVAKFGRVQEYAGDTDIFITPGYKFKVVDALITNFHLPKSTLLMLVSAFAGIDEIKCAYQAAIKRGYRFFSYGDACWLERR